jgi:hypothetical protein
MAVPEILWSAQRQYRHNRGDDGFICGFDQDETVEIVLSLQDRISELEEQVRRKDALLKKADGMISRNLATYEGSPVGILLTSIRQELGKKGE